MITPYNLCQRVSIRHGPEFDLNSYSYRYKFRSNRIPYVITPGSICRRSPVRHRSEFDLNLYSHGHNQTTTHGHLTGTVVARDYHAGVLRRWESNQT